ncbi:unnamed protein product [Durusdinium trenchii]|uniref:Secreted protein n=2 Tax=Durusdinium trenchii TaxID=1381693 RepID=A0ABP0J3Q1_9DINO
MLLASTGCLCSALLLFSSFEKKVLVVLKTLEATAGCGGVGEGPAVKRDGCGVTRCLRNMDSLLLSRSKGVRWVVLDLQGQDVAAAEPSSISLLHGISRESGTCRTGTRFLLP